jgi:MFS family permease
MSIPQPNCRTGRATNGSGPVIRGIAGSTMLFHRHVARRSTPLQLANGFFNTLISLQVAIESFEATMAGLVLSRYFAGFTLAALRCGPIIERVGHIRAYAAFAGMVVAATATMPLLLGPLSWLVLRALVGFGCARLFITTESWLTQGPAGGARADLLDLHGRHVPRPRAGTALDWAGRDSRRQDRSTRSSLCSPWHWSW